jgi:hypothetical protein
MDIWNIITGIATFIAMGIAVNEFIKRRKLEQFTNSSLRGIAGNLAKIKQSTAWAFNNFRVAQSEAVKLTNSENKNELLIKIADGQGDAASADRMIVNLLNEILTLQEGQFGTREITHPEKNVLEAAQNKDSSKV